MRNQLVLSFFVGAFFLSCQGQDSEVTERIVGGPCQGCEALFEFGDEVLNDTDTLPDFSKSKHQIHISGIVYQADGKTPASDVILYIYHTNRDGIYPKQTDSKGWGRRHGYLRGWVKTGPLGRYNFYTFRPAAYPNGQEPEHIHLTVKEPDTNPYYIDDYYFDDDPMLTQSERASMNNRGGSGIVSAFANGDVHSVRRDIFLGKNIPDY